MSHTASISDSSQLSPSNTCYTEEDIVSRPSFASRMIRLVFKRRRRSADEQAKSWPGCAKPAPLPVPTAARSQPSATIAIPTRLASSAPSKVPTAFTRPQQVRKHTMDDCTSEASWRQRQTHCVNCERLFFKSMSMLSNAAGLFCSLDCQASFEYLSQLQSMLDTQKIPCDGSSAPWNSSCTKYKCASRTESPFVV